MRLQGCSTTTLVTQYNQYILYIGQNAIVSGSDVFIETLLAIGPGPKTAFPTEIKI